ncbi:hypothetical protein ACFL7D_06890 [candidate division KSB1 bacterium]
MGIFAGFKINLFSVIVVILILGIFVPQGFAQKKTPPPVKIGLPDSTLKAKVSEKGPGKTGLSDIPLREYTIFGKERMRILPSQRMAIEIADITSKERIDESADRGERQVPGAGGEKLDRDIDIPYIGKVNEAYASFGRYTDMNMGFKLFKNFPKDELSIEADYHNNKGHVVNSDFYNFSGTLSNLHKFTSRILHKNQISFNSYNYNFYGSLMDPVRERKGFDVDFISSANISQWDFFSMRMEIGGRYFDPDDSEVFNYDAWTRFNANTIMFGTFINGLFEASTDRILDGAVGNANLNTANFIKSQITFERLLTQRVHLKAGAAFYSYYSDYLKNTFQKVGNNLQATYWVRDGQEDTDIYPIAALTFDMDDKGRFFIEYEPSIRSFNLKEHIQVNPYLELSSPIAYENTSHSVKAGWRRSYAYDLAFEIFYNDRRTKNYGIYIDRGLDPNFTDGIWTYSFDNTLNVNEYSMILNWNPHSRFNAWSSFSYMQYNFDDSQFAEKIPYLPNLALDFSIQYFPGMGIQCVLDGQYIGKRYIAPFELSTEENEIDAYILSNITISKQWNSHFGTYVYSSNILNQDFETWNNYLAPKVTAGAGFRYFW